MTGRNVFYKGNSEISLVLPKPTETLTLTAARIEFAVIFEVSVNCGVQLADLLLTSTLCALYVFAPVCLCTYTVKPQAPTSTLYTLESLESTNSPFVAL